MAVHAPCSNREQNGDSDKVERGRRGLMRWDEREGGRAMTRRWKTTEAEKGLRNAGLISGLSCEGRG